MYDDDVYWFLILVISNKYIKVVRYLMRNIKMLIVFVYGGSDLLVDIKVMLKEFFS